MCVKHVLNIFIENKEDISDVISYTLAFFHTVLAVPTLLCVKPVVPC